MFQRGLSKPHSVEDHHGESPSFIFQHFPCLEKRGHTTHLSCVSLPAVPSLYVWGSKGSREKGEPWHPLGVEGSRGADLLQASFPAGCFPNSLLSGTGGETEARGKLLGQITNPRLQVGVGSELVN